MISVEDPHHVDVGLDQTFYFEADAYPDQTSHFDADPDPTPNQK
jgi:hypothetical protein